ncbi:MAG: c-type cytochrome [Verrucomicrobiaceae bacterium]|nr:c-type cytochrome [Verrucomicrobiaceae bacterium]
MNRCLLALLLTSSVLLGQQNLTEIPPQDPAIEQASFKVAKGFEVNLWAADPLLAKPTQISFDHEGRLWVASSETYPQLNVNQEPNDRILILEDTDQDGSADKSSVFYDKLVIPGGVLPDGQGGAYVAHAEELIQLNDTDHDGSADSKTVLLSGFGTEDTHHTLHRLSWGPGGLLYMLQGYYIGTHVETLYGPRRLNGGGLWSYDTQTRRLEIYSRGLVNPWGVAFDRWGQSFQTDGAGGEGINYTFPDSVFKASPHEHRTLTGLNPGRPKLCGIEIISGDHFPAPWHGSVLANDFRANNIDRYSLEESASGFLSHLEDDLLQSTHVSFRPIDITMGPDGAVYIADWYSPIIQHGEVDFRDERRDQVHGRIWRITAKNRPLCQPVDYGSISVEQLLECLKSTADWVRSQAKQALKRHDQSNVETAIRTWLATLDPLDPRHEHYRLEALWSYQTICSAEAADFANVMRRSPEPRARAAAVRAFYHSQVEAGMLEESVNDPHPRVRREAVTVLGQKGSAEAARIALQALNHPMDIFLDFALWRTCRLLEPHWLAAFNEKGLTFKDNVDHLAFALKAIEKPEALAPLIVLVENDPEHADPAIVRLISKIGSSKDLNALLSLNTLDAVLALVEAARDRGVLPAQTSRLSSACLTLLRANDPMIVAAACRLAGHWKRNDLQAELEFRLTDPKSPVIQEAAAQGLAILGLGTPLIHLTNDDSATLASRVAAASALAQMDVAASVEPITNLLAEPLEEDAINTLVTSVLTKKGGAEALAQALTDQTVTKKATVLAMRLVETSGSPHTSLVRALTIAGNLQSLSEELTPRMLSSLLGKLDSGNASRGKLIYHRDQLACVTCHVIDGEGGIIGPDLSSIGASAPVDYLIESLIMPSKKIKEGYRMTLLTKKNGDVFSGAIVSEDQNVVRLRTITGQEARVPKSTIKTRHTSPVSLMPSGLTESLKEDEVIDLVAYLASLGKQK